MDVDSITNGSAEAGGGGTLSTTISFGASIYTLEGALFDGVLSQHAIPTLNLAA